jgi:MFS family permease
VGTTGQRHALVSAVLGNFSQFGARLIISPFVPAIATAFLATKSTIGLILTLMWALFAVLHYPAGVLADRYGAARVMQVGVGLAALGSLVVVLAPTLAVFAIGCLVLGIGGAAYFPNGQTFLSRRFGAAERGQALSIHSAGGPFAGVVMPAVATAVAARYDWRAGVAVGTVAATIATAILAIRLRGQDGGDPGVDITARLWPGTAVALLRRPAVLTTVALGGIGMYCFQAFISFYPTFLREYHGIAPQRASLLYSAGFVLVVLGLPIVGRIADRVGTERTLVVPFGAMVLAVALVLAVSKPWALILGSTLFGVGLSSGGAIAKRAMEHFADGDRGTGFGIVRMLFVLIGSLANVVTGSVAEYWGWVLAYGVIVALCVAVIGLLAVLVVYDPPQLSTDPGPGTRQRSSGSCE